VRASAEAASKKAAAHDEEREAALKAAQGHTHLAQVTFRASSDQKRLFARRTGDESRSLAAPPGCTSACRDPPDSRRVPPVCAQSPVCCHGLKYSTLKHVQGILRLQNS